VNVGKPRQVDALNLIKTSMACLAFCSHMVHCFSVPSSLGTFFATANFFALKAFYGKPYFLGLKESINALLGQVEIFLIV
jgi:hypothetical protein